MSLPSGEVQQFFTERQQQQQNNAIPEEILTSISRIGQEQINRDQAYAIQAIRLSLKSKSSYDVLPVSFRLIVLDTSLSVKRALNILLQNSIVSAPLWNSKTSRFAGLLTSADFINVIQYFHRNPEQDQRHNLDRLTLDSLREIEKAIGVEPIEKISTPPFSSIFLACDQMLKTKARRIPLVDEDKATHREIIVSVLTQYRILKFVALNCKETRMLMKPLKDIKFEKKYEELSVARMHTPVRTVINLLATKGISSVPIVDENFKLLNVYEAVDVLSLVKSGINNQELYLTVGQALMKRPDTFEGVYVCTLNDKLATILELIKTSKLHRLFIVDEEGKLLGLLTLSDILRYILFGET
ncbi:AMP-activated serine/threonine-protein kinase regulatory subunit SNF4 [Ascoidea rubescens DSM 1968]|uniref:CBS-domain-containing protein n=1 Tax=Ascoidea rubescens DSM 1968 TaxID=1344418 RepID=A0A1D2VJR8_9ASCO|nr:CBS-domain-containing protein [Ascoidea rubescens DSM 1968]ODV61747.1 CBS-domain-containing protein [Ascoidea rubescens DSM 1968]